MAEKKYFFHEAIDNLIRFITLHREYVCSHQYDFADELNKLGVQFYFNKAQSTAKACFWISNMLGNEHAFRNYLCI